MTETQMLAWINESPYEELLFHWRFAPLGDGFCRGKVGRHFAEVLEKKRAQDPARHLVASNAIGW